MEIEKVLPLQFIKKSPLYGSYRGMRYRFAKEKDQLQLCVFPEPYSFDLTPDEQKQYYPFPFTEEGYDEALLALNRIWREQFSA